MPTNYQGHWEHLFEGEKSPRMTKILVDVENETVVAAVIQRNRGVESSYTLAKGYELKDIQDSVINANGECLESPADYGLEISDSEPEWLVEARRKLSQDSGLSL